MEPNSGIKLCELHLKNNKKTVKRSLTQVEDYVNFIFKKKKKSSFLQFSILLKPHRAISKTKQKTHSKTYQTRHPKNSLTLGQGYAVWIMLPTQVKWGCWHHLSVELGSGNCVVYNSHYFQAEQQQRGHCHILFFFPFLLLLCK